MNVDDRIGRRLRLKDLHTLQTVAEIGSMAKASRQLGLSQPAISKAISDMEPVVRMLSASGHQLARRYPRISYQITVGDTDMLAREVRDRALDVVLTRWHALTEADDLVAETLYTSILAIVADKTHRMAVHKRLKLSDLMEEQWALPPPDTFLGRVVADLFEQKRLSLPSSIVTSTSTLMRLNLLANGRFLSVLPMIMLRHRSYKPWLRALRVDLGDHGGPISAITIKDRRSSGATKLFLEASHAVCEEFRI